ncbi:MAG: hypothetical protein GEU96_14750 [Propionibacteriales bacterium]|nr:hypothetical protein [Propionibacteriales bacterium]
MREPPGWVRRGPVAVVVWALLYGALRVLWAVSDPPDRMSPIGRDLLLDGWWAVLLCGAAAVLAVAMQVPASTAVRRLLLAGAGVTAAALAMSSALLLLDVVGGLLPGLGVEFFALGAASRAACLTGAVLLAGVAVTYSRRGREACLRCGRVAGRVRSRATPAWAWWGAYAAVAGCLLRIVAQYALFDDGMVFEVGPALVAFEVGFLLAGVALPLALVHGWGRRVGRWLLIVPGVALSAGLVAYFGFGTIQLTVETIRGAEQEWSMAFMWVAIPSYLVWGLGMGAAALAYFASTQPPCRRCGA